MYFLASFSILDGEGGAGCVVLHRRFMCAVSTEGKGGDRDARLCKFAIKYSFCGAALRIKEPRKRHH